MSGAGKWGGDVPGQVVSSWHIGPLQLHALVYPSVKLGGFLMIPSIVSFRVLDHLGFRKLTTPQPLWQANLLLRVSLSILFIPEKQTTLLRAPTVTVFIKCVFFLT